MRDLIASGKIHSGMERKDALALMPGKKQEAVGPALTAAVKTLLDVSIRDAGCDAVRAYVRTSQEAEEITPEGLDEAVRWLRNQRRGAA
jgi:hypothetical protein